MMSLPRPLRQVVALAILAALLIGAFAAVAIPLKAHIDSLEETIAARQSVLARYRTALSAAHSAQTMTANPVPDEAGRLFLEGSIISIALAGLQSTLNTIAADAGVRYRSQTTLPLRDDGDLKLVGVQANFSGTIDTVQQMLHAVETARPLLFIDSLSLRATGGAPQLGNPQSSDDPAAPGEKRSLDVQLGVLAAMRDGEAAQ